MNAPAEELLRPRILAALLSLAALATACTSDAVVAQKPPPLSIPQGCDPLLGGAPCFLPYPSDFSRIADPSTRTGFRILPREGSRYASTREKKSGDVHTRHVLDGFSTVATLVASLPGALSGTGLPNVTRDPGESTAPRSPTILLDTLTGKLVPHYADVIVPRDEAEAEIRRPILLRSFVKLEPRRRYVVALRGVVTESGERARPAEGFRRLRDRQAEEPELVSIQDRFESEIFSPLEKAGVTRQDLQLAWDFTTASEEGPKADMLRVRELTLAWLKEGAPRVEITEVEPRSGPGWKVVHGTLEGPSFLDGDSAGARLVRDPSGAVTQRGLTRFAFSIHVPASLKTRCIQGRSVAYGHGFFGTRQEMTSSPATRIGDKLSAVSFGVDWLGLSKPDLDWLARIITEEPSRVVDFTERIHQAMANWMVLTESVKRSLFAGPELRRPEAGEGACAEAGLAGRLLYDPVRVHYFGPSQGAILGGVLGALDPNLGRVALNVPGSGFTHMMPRAAPFGPLFALIHLVFGDALVDQAFAASFQGALDRVDPAIYAPNLLADRFPGSPEDRRVLLQVALGDSAVPNLGAFLHARILGIPQTSPPSFDVWRVPSAPAESSKSAMTLFDFGLGTDSPTPQPVTLNGVHDRLRGTDESILQLDRFLTPEGTVIHPCSGPCRLKLE